MARLRRKSTQRELSHLEGGTRARPRFALRVSMRIRTGVASASTTSVYEALFSNAPSVNAASATSNSVANAEVRCGNPPGIRRTDASDE